MLDQSSHPSPAFPIEVHYVVTDDLATESESKLKEVFMPAWLQVALPVVVIFQALTQLPKLLPGGDSLTFLGAVLLIAGFYAFMFWRSERNKRLARDAIVGKDVTVKFRDEGFYFAIGQKAESLGYGSVIRAGRDELGLVLIIEKFGGLWIPTRAFSSPEQRDFVFSHLGQFLKKR